ncbi:hypothetical protein LCGC14_1163970 [marine sediment metagenome]|uniref:Periplasmic copper-binding protein NosD beta helix domain-containing protein n=1 Tax=marine sediment metagenome TaxID=412755 RepID=A0A0F9MEX0_9ZZZZ
MLKNKLVLILVLLIGLGILVNIDYIGSTYDNIKYEYTVQIPKGSGYWDLTGSPIRIDDNDPSKNWAITSAANDWCSGSGTWNDPYIIENVIIDGLNGRIDSPISVRSSNVYFIIRNSILYNSGLDGFDLDRVNNGKIINNNILFNRGSGIKLVLSNNITISNNSISNNDKNGIILVSELTNYYTKYNTILENNINHNGEEGIYLKGDYSENVNHNNITGNILNFNGNNGVYIYYSGYNILFNNTVNNNIKNGFLAKRSYFNTFLENIVNNNAKYGIEIIDGVSNIIKLNKLNFNKNGLYLTPRSHSNTVYENDITYNKLQGIITDTDNYITSNVIYNNNFIGNSINAVDLDSKYTAGLSSNNNWDNGTIGNYWDDYGGNDTNNDGIGDIPYNITGSAGSQDNFPIYKDGNDVSPIITIHLPILDEIFGMDAPEYKISVFELYLLNTTWYTIDNGITNYTISEFTGLINQSAWDKMENGLVTIKFYVNDSTGYVVFNEINIIKEILILNSNADIPDTDGIFTLYWTNYKYTNNYFLYQNDVLLNSGLIELDYLIEINLNGNYSFKVISFNDYGNITSNEIIVNIEIPPIEPNLPSPFNLTSNADNPDIDGIFLLNWTISEYANNYSVYQNDVLIDNGLVELYYYMEIYTNGNYSFKVISFNDYGNITSNEIIVNIEIPPTPIEPPELPIEPIEPIELPIEPEPDLPPDPDPYDKPIKNPFMNILLFITILIVAIFLVITIPIVLIHIHKRKVPKEIIIIQEREVPNVIYCPECGTKILDEIDSFCSGCGFKIKGVNKK